MPMNVQKNSRKLKIEKKSTTGSKDGSISNQYLGGSSIHTYFPTNEKKSNSGYQDGGKDFGLTNREVLFEEECTYNADGTSDRCIFCQKGSNPPLCIDPNAPGREFF